MKTFKQISEMSMSVTLKPKKNNMYKVTGVGKKMAAHGGIKKGEKFHDSEIDGMNDSGIKVKYEKPKKMKEHIVQEVKMPEDGKAYMVKNCGCLKDPCDEYGSIKEQIKKGEAKMKPVEEDMMPGEGKATVKGGKLRMQRTMDKHGVQQQKPPIKGKVGKFKKVGESIQRRMDRMTIIATDPATGRKVVKVAPKKEIDIGKGKMESVVNEISDKMKVNYIKKAGKDVSYLEKQKMKPASKQVNNVRMDRDSAPFYKDVNKKNIDKEITKRRKGMRMATGKLGNTVRQTVKQSGMKLGLSQGMKPSSKKLGEDNLQELETSTLASYQKKAGAQYQKAKRDSDPRTAYKYYSVKGGRAADKAEKLKQKRGKGLSQSKKILDKRYSDKQVKMGKGIAFDKRYKGGNMTGASKAIDKIKKGLSDHPKVSGALKRANEELNKGE